MGTIGFVGLGAMGLGMAGCLVQQGFDVCGFDVREGPMGALAESGGRRAAGLHDVAGGADAVFVMVANGQQVRDVVCGEAGVAQHMRAGATVIVTSTTHESDVQALEEPLAALGLGLIDAPVSGGDFGARAGTLSMMVACRQAVLDANLHVLRAVGRTITHVGERIGAGQASKAVLQSLVAATFASLCEASVLGARAGIQPDALAEILSESVVGSPLVRNALAKMAGGRYSGSGAWVGLICKDLDASMELGRRFGVPMFTAAAAQQVMRATYSMFPDGDIWSAARFVESASEARD